MPPPRRDDRVRRRGDRRRSCADRRPDHVIVATGAAPSRPWWVGRRRRPTRATCATCSPAPPRRSRRGRADRRDRVPPRHVGGRAARRPRLPTVEVVTPGDGRRPGPRHHARHGAVVDARRTPRGSCSPPTSCRWASTATTLTLLHHPTGRQRGAHPRLGRARGARRHPAEQLYLDLRAPPASRPTASATASPPAAPTPPSSRASGPGAAIG